MKSLVIGIHIDPVLGFSEDPRIQRIQAGALVNQAWQRLMDTGEIKDNWVIGLCLTEQATGQLKTVGSAQIYPQRMKLIREVVYQDLEAQVRQLEKVLHFLEHAPFDFRNGIEYHGIDEGEVYGDRALRELVNETRLALGLDPLPEGDTLPLEDDEDALPF